MAEVFDWFGIVTELMIFSLAILESLFLFSCALCLFFWLFVSLHFVFVTLTLHYLFSVQLELNNFMCLAPGSKINATNVFLNYWKPLENPLKAKCCLWLQGAYIIVSSVEFCEKKKKKKEIKISVSMSWFLLLSSVFVTVWAWNYNVPSAFRVGLKQTQTNSTLFIFHVLPPWVNISKTAKSNLI